MATCPGASRRASIHSALSPQNPQIRVQTLNRVRLAISGSPAPGQPSPLPRPQIEAVRSILQILGTIEPVPFWAFRRRASPEGRECKCRTAGETQPVEKAWVGFQMGLVGIGGSRIRFGGHSSGSERCLITGIRPNSYLTTSVQPCPAGGEAYQEVGPRCCACGWLTLVPDGPSKGLKLAISRNSGL